MANIALALALLSIAPGLTLFTAPTAIGLGIYSKRRDGPSRQANIAVSLAAVLLAIWAVILIAAITNTGTS